MRREGAKFPHNCKYWMENGKCSQKTRCLYHHPTKKAKKVPKQKPQPKKKDQVSLPLPAPVASNADPPLEFESEEMNDDMSI
jgi:hypothetical protein